MYTQVDHNFAHKSLVKYNRRERGEENIACIKDFIIYFNVVKKKHVLCVIISNYTLHILKMYSKEYII